LGLKVVCGVLCVGSGEAGRLGSIEAGRLESSKLKKYSKQFSLINQSFSRLQVNFSFLFKLFGRVIKNTNAIFAASFNKYSPRY
jgi:hypothetical protein